MQTINLGRSPVSSSIMGFGCMGMSEFYGAHDDESSLRTLERALELGVTHYDTSNVYGRGANEKLLGRFAKGKRDQLTICPKFGVVREPDSTEERRGGRECVSRCGSREAQYMTMQRNIGKIYRWKR